MEPAAVRENMKEKKQCDFILTDKAIRSLDELAEKHDLAHAKVLEILVLAEKEKDMYIPGRLKMLDDQ